MGFGASCTIGQRRSSFLAFAKEMMVGDGIVYDIADLSTLFADVEGTTPAAIDGPVALVKDKLGNEQHAVQADEACRPILRSDGLMFWLEFDGIDDHLTIASSSMESRDAGTVLCLGFSLGDAFASDPIVAGKSLSLTTSSDAGSRQRWRTELLFADGSKETANSASGSYALPGERYCRCDVDDNETFTTRINGVPEIQVRRNGEPWANDEIVLFKRDGRCAKACLYSLVLVPCAVEESKLTRIETYVSRKMRCGEIK